MSNAVNFDLKCRMVDEELRSFWPEWQVVRRLGGGSFGDVFHITRTKMGLRTDSAMKVIQIMDEAEPTTPLTHIENSARYMDDSTSDKAFESDVRMQQTSPLPTSVYNEIRIMETLRGAPNIVAIEDFYYKRDPYGSNAARLYIRMELLTSFQELLSEKGPSDILSVPEICRFATDICTALDYCEKNNIIHRDIKPANMFVDRFGNYKIGDFGASRRVESLQMAQTMTGIGTISYMAPEIYKRTAYDHTVDIYALGLVLYQLLNQGRVPFLPDFPSEYTTADIDTANYKRLHGIKIRKLRKVDPELDSIVRKACAFDAKDRYNTAAEMKLAVEQYLLNRRRNVLQEGEKRQNSNLPESSSSTDKNSADWEKDHRGSQIQSYANDHIMKKEKPRSFGRGLFVKRLALIGAAAACIVTAVCIVLRGFHPVSGITSGGNLTNASSAYEETTVGLSVADVQESQSVAEGAGGLVTEKESSSKKNVGNQENDISESSATNKKELERQYQEAEACLQEKDYLKAAIGFGRVSGYRDAEERSLALWTQYGNCSILDIHNDSIAAIADDGTVYSSNFSNFSEEEYKEINTWTEIVSVRRMRSNNYLIGLKTDGTVVSSAFAHFSGLEGGEPDPGLAGIVEIEPIINGGFAALGVDGSVYLRPVDYNEYWSFAGYETNEDTEKKWKIDKPEWHDIEHIAGGYGGVLGIRRDGILLFHPTEEDSEIPEYHRGYGEDRRFNDFQGMQFREIGVDTIGGSWMYVLLDTDGKVHILQTSSEEGYTVLSEKEVQEVESYHDVIDISVGMCTVLLLHEDGTISITRADSYRSGSEMDAALSWKDIVNIAYDDNAGIAGIRNDGSFLFAGDEIGTPSVTSDWENIEKIVSGGRVALKKDGTAVAAGASLNSRLEGKKELTDITPMGIGLQADGTLCNLWLTNDYIRRFGKEADAFWEEISKWKDIVQIENSSWYGAPCAVLHSDGTVTVSRKLANTEGMENAERLYACEEWESVESIYFGVYVAAGLKKDGTVCYSYYGDSEEKSNEMKAMKEWNNIVKIVGDNDSIAALSSKGKVFCTDATMQSRLDAFCSARPGMKALDLQFKDFKNNLYCKFEDGWREFSQWSGEENLSETICAGRNVKQLVDTDSGMIFLYESGHVVNDSMQLNSTEAMKTWKNLRVQ